MASFAGAWLAIGAALLSPIDRLSSSLFWVHMVQHELLMMVAAPLFVLARPLAPAVRALPAPLRRTIAGRPHPAWLSTAWTFVSRPVAASILFGVLLWVWHLPALYDAALEDPAVHAAQHLCFFLSALLFFWVLVNGRYGRLAYGASVAYVFLTAVHSNALGALLTVSPSALYPFYRDAPQTPGLTALGDQQLAGLVMWVPSGLVLIGLGLALFAAWLAESERRAILARGRMNLRDQGRH